MKKEVIIVGVVIGILSLMLGVCLIYKNKKLDSEFNYSKNGIAIMVDEKGDGNYVKYNSKDGSWPGEGYEYSKSKCVNNDGSESENIVTFNDSNPTISETSEAVFCTLYFNKSK